MALPTKGGQVLIRIIPALTPVDDMMRRTLCVATAMLASVVVTFQNHFGKFAVFVIRQLYLFLFRGWIHLDLVCKLLLEPLYEQPIR